MSVSRSALESSAARLARKPSCSPPRRSPIEVGDGADALRTLALGAQLVVVNHLGQTENARFQRALAILVEEELGIGQARPHDALVAADHARSGRPG
jgi:hypothetical protein